MDSFECTNNLKRSRVLLRIIFDVYSFVLFLFQLDQTLWANLLKVLDELYRTSRMKAQLVSNKNNYYWSAGYTTFRYGGAILL